MTYQKQEDCADQARAGYAQPAGRSAEQSEPAHDPVFDRLELEARRQMRGFRLAITAILAYALITAALLLLTNGGVKVFTPAIFVIVGLAVRRQVQAVGAVAEYGGVRAVPSLVEALEGHGRRVGGLAARRLAELLPSMRPADAALLSPGHHAALARALTVRRDTSLALSILRALEQIGDGSETAAVAQLAARRGANGRDPGVAADAGAILPTLTVRAEARRSAQTLLRPAADPAPPSEALLRPARSAPDSNPHVLVRPADPPPDG